MAMAAIGVTVATVVGPVRHCEARSIGGPTRRRASGGEVDRLEREVVEGEQAVLQCLAEVASSAAQAVLLREVLLLPGPPRRQGATAAEDHPSRRFADPERIHEYGDEGA